MAMRFSCRQTAQYRRLNLIWHFCRDVLFYASSWKSSFLEITFLGNHVAGDSEVIFGSAQFVTRMPRPDRMEFDRKG
jgi:hypothetical protein